MTVWQKLTVVLLAALIVGGAVHFLRLVQVPQGGRPKVAWVQYVHPNVGKLERARQLVAAGKADDARTVLIEALTSAPTSPVTRDLRDLLGEINTRLFFSDKNSPRKQEYTVNSGDALSSIARRLQSSTDAIMRVNDLNSTIIRPGEILFVPHLDFTITIDLPRERVVVHDGHGFFTQYPIAAVDLPATRSLVVQTKVRAKSFLPGAQPLAENGGAPDPTTPLIFLQRRGYVLYGVDENSETSAAAIEVEGEPSTQPDATPAPDRPPQGIAILKKDIAELDLLIRRGTPVTVLLEQK